MQKRVNVFIASSMRGAQEAQIVAAALANVKGKIPINPVRWWEVPDFSHILTNLIRQTSECDFSVILLTKDDVVSRDGDDATALKARDNCIFEAGLFAGALGPDPERCFLLVSVHPRVLPSDLAGLRYIDIYQFDDTDERHSRDEVTEKLKQAANIIGAAIDASEHPRANRGLKLPIITERELMGFESLVPDGNLREHSANVFVSSPQPLELDEDFAMKVIANMVNGRIGYRYVFEAHERGTALIANVVGSLVEVKKIRVRSKEVKRTPQENLETLRKYLRIHFLPDMPGLHYCVHNANLYDHAICYLRTPVKSTRGEIQFVEWCRGNDAVLVAHEINRMCKEPEDDPNRVFNSTVHYRLYDSEHSKFNFALLGDVRSRLSDIEPKQVEEVFFGQRTIA
ncbi:MAG: nucleotide-binding protein [Nitrososphaera sp.]|nr:nucleotide-binding protein [Nitrososphaera sp.]